MCPWGKCPGGTCPGGGGGVLSCHVPVLGYNYNGVLDTIIMVCSAVNFTAEQTIIIVFDTIL